ncbi:plastid division protein PDV1-like [Juglans microcarpa x Juglans regia]|uniref:plastid division protein PDV1-like n=1 Tax=Juglans microcarpa x Juglans regia TaxID=2249226 RepID=UPI001B7E07D2|nr:plastid division protein PDV1-like [Juglans microcarpa x Juglans regia]
MKWEMKLEEIEAILEKIWDLHDKLSDAIHSISRTHFLNSVKAQTKPEKIKHPSYNCKNSHNDTAEDNVRASGFVFVKDFRVDDGDDSAVQEAKSLNAIRTALENLEDQLEFFHTVQMQQRAERDAAIARLEQSRIVLAMRLADHHGKKFKVIEEALAFVGDVHDAGHFVSPEKLYGQPYSPFGEKLATHVDNRPNILIKVLISSFDFAKKSLKLDGMGGVLGNAALFAVSMIALMHLHQVAYKEHPQKREDDITSKRNVRQTFWAEESSSNSHLSQLDVLSGRG